MKKKNPNELGLPVVDWMGVGLGNFTHFKQEKKLSVNVNHFNFFKGSIFFFWVQKVFQSNNYIC